MYSVRAANIEVHQEDINRVTKKHVAWAKKEELIEAAIMKQDMQGLEDLEIFESESLEEASKFYENETKYKVFSPEYMNVGKYWLFHVITLIKKDEDWGNEEISRTYL